MRRIRSPLSPASGTQENLPTPGTDLRFEECFDFPCVADGEAVNYLANHGRVMFIIRGFPGTGKNTLSSMLMSKYLDSEQCSADDYFDEPFVQKIRNSVTLKASHNYCNEKATKACQENKHPIIIKNSAIRKWEMQKYINLAAEYCYTVLMVITQRKLSATSEILEKTNKQGLNRHYFERRLKQWEDVIPQYTCWMLCPADAACIMAEGKKYLESLSELEDFCEVCSTYPKGNPKDFKPEYFPFCLATFCGLGANSSARDYYLSKSVQNAYGRTFSLVVQAFIVTKSLTAAVVYLEENMKDLVREIVNPVSWDADELSDALGAMSTSCSVRPIQPVTDFATNSVETVSFCSRNADEKLYTKNFSFIILSTSTSSVHIKNISLFRERLFSDITDSSGCTSFTAFKSLGDNFKYYRFPDDSWMILPPEKIVLQSVFTGLYK